MTTKTTPPQGTLLRPLAYEWFRGPATRERDVIVMDGRRAERYEPMLELNSQSSRKEPRKRIGLELARVRTPEDAVAFVARFGMLNQPRGVLEGETCPPELRQPFADFERAAEDLRRILRTVLDVRKAVAGDRAALARVRKDFAPPDPDSDQRIQTADGMVILKARDLYRADYFTQDDRAILVRASHWAAMGLSNGLVNAHAYVFEPAQLFPDPHTAPGGLRVGMIGDTLLDFCYLTVAQAIATEPLAVCDECNRVFVVDDKRQRFCEPSCANRARFRRFKTKKTTQTPTTTTSKKNKTTPKKRSQHGNTKTRKR